jgi:hypothetical protein
MPLMLSRSASLALFTSTAANALAAISASKAVIIFLIIQKLPEYNIEKAPMLGFVLGATLACRTHQLSI